MYSNIENTITYFKHCEMKQMSQYNKYFKINHLRLVFFLLQRFSNSCTTSVSTGIVTNNTSVILGDLGFDAL